MILNGGKKLKVVCCLVMLGAIALLPSTEMSNLQAQEDETFHVAPLNPDFVEFCEEPPDIELVEKSDMMDVTVKLIYAGGNNDMDIF